MRDNKITIGMTQFACVPDRSENMKKAEEQIRALAAKGADFVFYPSAIGSEPDYPELNTSQTWMDRIRGHGIHNGFYVCACNRVGREYAADGSGSMEFYGRSFVSDPWQSDRGRRQRRRRSDHCGIRPFRNQKAA